MRRLTIALLALATVTLIAAAYLFSFGVPLEAACHMHDASACARLEHTLRLSRGLAFVALAFVGCAVFGGVAFRIHSGSRAREPASAADRSA
jgi:hypothetical protein